MRITNWLFESMRKLGNSGVDSPRRDALVLLEDTIGRDRSWVLAHPEFELSKDIVLKLENLINRRIAREPLAYIRGKAWFYKRFFKVNSNVMIPRPESESFIELLKDVRPDTIIDIGTGSGSLGITAKLEIPDAIVIAIDQSKKALKIASKNAQMHGIHVEFFEGDLLSPLDLSRTTENSAFMANLPYVPQDLITSPEITHEPHEALFSGKDGMWHYRRFWQQIADISRQQKVKYVLVESLESQHGQMVALAEQAGYTLQKTTVLIQLFVVK